MNEWEAFEKEGTGGETDPRQLSLLDLLEGEPQ